jgi:uncharacterized cupredoxin-like copper-binding protein
MSLHPIQRIWSDPTVAYRWARRFVWLGFGLIIGLSLMSAPLAIAAPATSDPAHQTLIPVEVSLGTADNELRFVPANLTFEPGKRYKLTLSNPSTQKHYFTAKDFADSLWSQKVDAGNVEIKGAIHELEIRPGAIVQWVFVPMKSGTYELHCAIPGHTEAGMKGQLSVAS